MTAWMFLIDARSKLLKWWFWLCMPILVLVFIQTINGKYTGISGQIWLWVMLIVLPGALLLMVHTWLNRSPAKLIHPNAYKALLALEVLYLGTAFMSIIAAQAAVEQQEIGLDQYFSETYIYLGPLNALVVIGSLLFFYKKESLFRPNPAIIMETAGKKAFEAKKKGLTLRSSCYDAVANNDLVSAFAQMQTHFEARKNQDALDGNILLKSRLNQLLKNRDLNLVEPEAAQITLNQITVAILSTIEEVEG
jgi:Effector-associated domain 11